MEMKIIYIACGPNVPHLFLPVAAVFKKRHPEAVNLLIDPASVLYESFESDVSPAEIFTRYGFEGEKVNSEDYSDLKGMYYPYMAYLFYLRLFRRLKPSVVIVPYEFSYCFYAVQTAKILGIPTYHLQHGVWGPEYFKTNPLSVKSDDAINSLPGAANKVEVKEERGLRKFLARYINRVGVHRPKSSEPQLPAELLEFKDKLRLSKKGYQINADRFALFSRYYKELLKRLGPDLPEDLLDVVGFLKGDSFYNNPIETKETIYKRYGLDLGGRLALYFYAPFHLVPSDFKVEHDPEEALVEAVKTLKVTDDAMNVLILVHPAVEAAQTREDVKKLIERNGLDGVRIGVAENDHYSLYKQASIVMGVFSTTLYEAMLATTPILIQAYVLSKVFAPQIIEAGAAASVFSPLHLKGQIRRVFEDEGYRQRMFENQKMLCKEILGPFDGKCGERVVRSIEGLIEEYGRQSGKGETKNMRRAVL